MSDTNKNTPESDAKAQGAQPNPAEALQQMAAAMPQNLEFPVGVYSDGNVLFINQTTNEGTEKTPEDILALIKSKDTIGNELLDATFKGRLYAIYVAQKLALGSDNTYKDDVGNPGFIEHGNVGFSFLVLGDHISKDLEQAVEAVEKDIEDHPEIGIAKNIFLDMCKDLQKMGQIKNPYELIIKQTFFQWLPEQEIQEFIEELQAEEQTDETKDQITRLESGLQMLEQSRKAAQALAAAQKQAPADTLIARPVSVNADGTATLSDTKTKEEKAYTQAELISLLTGDAPVEIMGVITALITQQIFAATKDEDKTLKSTGEFISARLPRKTNPVKVLIDGKEQTFQVKQYHNDVEADFSILRASVYSNAASDTRISEAVEALKADNKDDERFIAAIDKFEEVRKQLGPQFPLHAEVKRLLTTKRSYDEVKDLHTSTAQDTHEYEALDAALSELQTLKDQADADMAAQAERNKKSEQKTQSILARGRLTTQASETWKEIRTQPKEEQSLAMLKAFCPSTEGIFKEGKDYTTKGDHNFVQLAATAWRADREAALLQNLTGGLGDRSPQEQALATLLLDATENAFKQSVLLEAIANDPWLRTRAEKKVFLSESEKIDDLNDQFFETYEDWTSSYTDNYIRLDEMVTDENGWLAQQSKDLIASQLESFAQKTSASWTTKASAGIKSIFGNKASSAYVSRQIAQAIQNGDLASLGIEEDRMNTIFSEATKISGQSAGFTAADFQAIAQQQPDAPKAANTANTPKP